VSSWPTTPENVSKGRRAGEGLRFEQWNVEAGAAFFDDTVAGVQKGIEEARAAAAKRPSTPYARGKQ